MSLDPETVRVRFLSLDGVSGSSLLAWRSMLDDEERRRADRFYFQRDRDTFTAAHALARAMLSEASGEPTTSWRFVRGANGKPKIAADCSNHPLCFNISHANGLVACAVSGSLDVGVDVETSDRTTELDIADTYFAPEETAIVRSAPPDQRHFLFFRIWTLKEAFIKATGEGLSRPLNSFAFMLDPIRVVFYPDREGEARDDSSRYWQFAQCCPAPNQFLALALRRSDAPDVSVDIKAARPDEIAPF